MADKRVKLITIPEYFRAYVDPNVDLTVTHNIPCPFHHEESGKSFTYSVDKDIWRCWGACHAGGDVIALHQLHHGIARREDAKRSLYKLLGIEDSLKPTFEKEDVYINEVDIERREVYSKAIRCAKTIDDWIELDYLMGQVPYSVDDLKQFIHMRSNVEGDGEDDRIQSIL